MEIPCEMIRDLLPVYLAECCGDASREAVEAHVARCPECEALLRSLEREEERLRKWGPLLWLEDGFRWLRDRRRGIAVCVLLVLLGLGARIGWYQLTEVDRVPVSPEDYRVVRVLGMPDGDIYCEYRIRYGATFRRHYVIRENAVYFTAMRPVLDRIYPGEGQTGKWLMDPDSVWDREREVYVSVDAIYLGNPQGAHIPVWQRGTAPEAAAPEEAARIEGENWIIF